MIEIGIRSYRESDKNFVYSTWLNSQFMGCTTPYRQPKNSFFDTMQTVVDKAMETGMCFVAVNLDDDDHIMGYIVFKNKTVHYIFVKQVFERLGVAKKLLEACDLIQNGNELSCSQLTKQGISKFKKYRIDHNPYKELL